MAREDDFDTFLKKALFDPDESVRKSLQSDTREESRDRAEELRASLRRLEKRDAERETTARTAREAAAKATTRDTAREAIADRVRQRARELETRDLATGPAPPLGRDSRESLRLRDRDRMRESEELTRYGDSAKIDRLGREIAALDADQGSPARELPRGDRPAPFPREREESVRSARRSRSAEGPSWRGTASPALDRRIFADRADRAQFQSERSRVQRDRRWGLEDASGRFPRRESRDRYATDRPPSPYRSRASPPRGMSWERALDREDDRLRLDDRGPSSFSTTAVRDLGRGGDAYSARDEHEKHNLRQRVDRLADGVARAHNLIADHELRQADSIEALGTAVRSLQEDVVDLRELMREREKATERTLADFRAYLEGSARRTDSGLLHLQAGLDGLTGKVETLHRGLGALEHEVLA